MNWTGRASRATTALSPVWKSAIGDQVTGTDEWASRIRKRLSFCFNKLGSPCGNGEIGRLSLIKAASSGPGALEQPLNSQPVPRLRGSSKWEKAGINWTWSNVQYTRGVVQPPGMEKA